MTLSVQEHKQHLKRLGSAFIAMPRRGLEVVGIFFLGVPFGASV